MLSGREGEDANDDDRDDGGEREGGGRTVDSTRMGLRNVVGADDSEAGSGLTSTSSTSNDGTALRLIRRAWMVSVGAARRCGRASAWRSSAAWRRFRSSSSVLGLESSIRDSDVERMRECRGVGVPLDEVELLDSR